MGYNSGFKGLKLKEGVTDGR